MAALEDIAADASVRGVLPNSLVTVINVRWFGSDAIELTYKDPSGKVANELLYREDEARLEIVSEAARPTDIRPKDKGVDIFGRGRGNNYAS